MGRASHYIHGSSQDEQRRLSLLNGLLNGRSIAVLPIVAGARILDVGSGTGQFTRLMARKARPGGFTVGIERDTGQLAEADRLASEAGEGGLVEFRSGDAYAFPLADDEWGTFDLVHARFLLEHLQAPEKALVQMMRAVRPGGTVILADDDHRDFRPYPEPPYFTELWDAYIRTYDALGNDPFIGRRLVKLMHDAGLEEIKNASIFFGGCAGEETFPAVADNLEGVLIGAKQEMIARGYLDSQTFDVGLDGLKQWRQDPSAALWYSICWASGRRRS